jgi:hypothetical protein
VALPSLDERDTPEKLGLQPGDHVRVLPQIPYQAVPFTVADLMMDLEPGADIVVCVPPALT